MDLGKLFDVAVNFGPVGLIVFYLIYREDQERKSKHKLAEQDIASREKLTSVLTALYIAITGKPYV